MTGFERFHVSHHQFLVRAGTRAGDLPLFTVGDRLVQLTGDGQLNVFTGPHSARLPVRVTLGRPGPPDGCDAASEATLFCDRGTLSVGGLMGDRPRAFAAMPVPVGDAELRLRPEPDAATAEVRWTVRPGGGVPGPEPSTVELTPDGLVHRGVRAADAVPLGLVWDHLVAGLSEDFVEGLEFAP